MAMAGKSTDLVLHHAFDRGHTGRQLTLHGARVVHRGDSLDQRRVAPHGRDQVAVTDPVAGDHQGAGGRGRRAQRPALAELGGQRDRRLALLGRVLVDRGRPGDDHRALGAADRLGLLLVDRDVAGLRVGGQHRGHVVGGRLRAADPLHQGEGELRAGRLDAVAVDRQSLERDRALRRLAGQVEQLGADVGVEKLVLHRHLGGDGRPGDLQHRDHPGHVVAGVGQRHHHDATAGQLAVEQRRGDLGGEVLAAVDLVAVLVDLIALVAVVLLQRVELVAQAVGHRPVERRGAHDQADGQGEEDRGERHHVVPKVDHDESPDVVRKGVPAGRRDCPTTRKPR
jgi:hypothetical protein